MTTVWCPVGTAAASSRPSSLARWPMTLSMSSADRGSISALSQCASIRSSRRATSIASSWRRVYSLTSSAAEAIALATSCLAACSETASSSAIAHQDRPRLRRS